MPEPTDADAAWPDPPRVRCAIVVVDVVESVRLMQAFEADVIDRWRRFVNDTRLNLLPAHAGRLVKHLGDGMLLQFERVSQAVGASRALHARIGAFNAGRAPEAWLQLRAGVHWCDVVEDEFDVYGSGVNMAARLATLAAPGGTVISADARAELVDGFDPEFEDIGDCYVRNLAQPLRAYRALDPALSFAPRLAAPTGDLDIAPTLLVLPLELAAPDAELALLRRVVLGELERVLARRPHWRVVSALSSAGLADRGLPLAQLAGGTGATHVVCGTLVRRGSERCAIDWRLSEAGRGHTLWEDHDELTLAALVGREAEAYERVGRCIERAMFETELIRSSGTMLPNLPGYSLLVSSISRMHRLSRGEFDAAGSALEHLAWRHPRAPAAHAWRAKWHLLRILQVWSEDPARDASAARESLRSALDREPGHALALAIDGHLRVMFDGDMAGAQARLDEALQANPSEALAWLFLSNVQAGRDDGPAAVAAVDRAIACSPLDPIGYFFDTFAAVAYIAADRFDEAIEHARRSLRRNALHLPGLMQLIVAQALAGRMDDARASAQRYLALRPGASVQRYVQMNACFGPRRMQRTSQAMLEAGIPA